MKEGKHNEGSREITVTLTKDEISFIHFALNDSINQCLENEMPVMRKHLIDLRKEIQALEVLCN